MLNIHFHCVILHLTTKTHIASGGQKSSWAYLYTSYSIQRYSIYALSKTI